MSDNMGRAGVFAVGDVADLVGGLGFHWPRIKAASSSGVAWSGVRLGIPSTAMRDNRLPVVSVTSRSIRKAWRASGKRRFLGAGSTRIVRVSMRLRPRVRYVWSGWRSSQGSMFRASNSFGWLPMA